MTRHRIMGARVYHICDDLIEIMRLRQIKAVFVSASSSEVFKGNVDLINKLIKNNIKIMMQPIEMEWDGKSDINFRQLHEVDIEDLLPRDRIDIDLDSIGKLIKHKVVLITGAAGSIGYEMARQVAKFSPERLVLVDQAETPMHTVRLHMAKHYGWLEKRKRYLPEGMPTGGAIHNGGLVDCWRDRCKASDEQDGEVSNVLPEIHYDCGGLKHGVACKPLIVLA